MGQALTRYGLESIKVKLSPLGMSDHLTHFFALQLSIAHRWVRTIPRFSCGHPEQREEADMKPVEVCVRLVQLKRGLRKFLHKQRSCNLALPVPSARCAV